MLPLVLSIPSIAPSLLMKDYFSQHQHSSICYLVASAIVQALAFFAGSKRVSLQVLSANQDGCGGG